MRIKFFGFTLTYGKKKYNKRKIQAVPVLVTTHKDLTKVKRYKRFTPEEIKLIKNREHSIKYLARLLNRSKKSIEIARYRYVGPLNPRLSNEPNKETTDGIQIANQ